MDYDLQKFLAKNGMILWRPKLPKTSQPRRVAELDSLLKDLEKQGYTHVLGLFLPAAISGFLKIFLLQSEYEQIEN